MSVATRAGAKPRFASQTSALCTPYSVRLALGPVRDAPGWHPRQLILVSYKLEVSVPRLAPTAVHLHEFVGRARALLRLDAAPPTLIIDPKLAVVQASDIQAKQQEQQRNLTIPAV